MLRSALGALCILAGFSAQATEAATGIMLRHAALGSGNSADIVFGDLDDDGDLDAVIGNAAGEAETVWLNDGHGNFSPHPLQSSFGAGNTSAIALGDLDGDGDLDAIIGNAGEAETVWLNDGDGRFSAHPATPLFGSGDTRDLTVGDLDGDDDLDVIVASHSAESNTVWLNDGDGSFSANGSFGGSDSLGVLLGNLDSDGDLDAILVSEAGAAVWLNDGTGTFAAQPSFTPAPSRAVGLGDLDGDGDLDAVVAGEESDTVWVNDGDGNFTEHPVTPELDEENGGTDVEVNDIDGDGDPDVLIATGGAGVSVWLNDGDGNLSPHTAAASFGSGSHRAITSGDVDGDGDVDVATCSGEGATLYLNTEIAVSAASAATTEAGGTATFTVVLEREPTANVTVQLTSSDATEAWLSTGGPQQESVTLTFTSANWDEPRVVTIHGQDDAVDDGDVAYTIVTATAVSADPFFAGVDVGDVANTNTDDDTAGVTITPSPLTVNESERKEVKVVLDTQPTGNVVLDFATTDNQVIAASRLTFTSASWSTPQKVGIRGTDDGIIDGDTNTIVSVTVDAAATADPLYDALDPADLTVTVTDDDFVGVTVSPLSVTVVESGNTASFTVQIRSKPAGDVVIDLTPLDIGEATVSPAQLRFHDNSPLLQQQTVTVRAVEDGIADGDQVSTVAVTVNAAGTSDPLYAELDPADVSVTTIDRAVTTTTFNSSVNPSVAGQTVGSRLM